jgi:predicted ATPase/DNA-binding winged helix-turn-helix (wHTH) protein
MGRHDAEEEGYSFGAFRLLPKQRLLLRGDERMPLNPRAFSVLLTLVQRYGQAVTKDELMAEAWPNMIVDESNMAAQVRASRLLLGREAIQTIAGVGYQFTIPVKRLGGDPAEPAPSPPPPARRVVHLPEFLAALIGRETGLAALEDLVGQYRLVSLTGPGGVGKTRLAVELGWKMLERFPDGVALINLAPLADPAAMLSATATALGVALRGIAASADTIAGALRGKRMLLIFDNCEHLIEAAAALVEDLLRLVPSLSVLVTSQENLRVPGEKTYPLRPLELPPLGSDERAATINNFGAVALFVSYVQAGLPHFRLDDGNAADVAAICRGLDGIPLTLELAASAVRSRGLKALRARLDERLKILSVAMRTADRRHLTLMDMLDSSHDLLDSGEQRVFRRLALFRGSFSPEAAAAVAAEETADPDEILGRICRLVDKSMVMVEDGGEARYRLLHTLRLYAFEKLRGCGEVSMLVDRHARYFIDFFEGADDAWEVMPDGEWLRVYAPNIDNIRAALDAALDERGREAFAVALAGAVGRLWERLSLLPEGRRYLDQAVDLIDALTVPADAARALRFAGLLWYSSDRLRSLALFQRSAALYRQLEDSPKLGSVLSMIGGALLYLGRFAEAKDALVEARRILRGGEQAKSCNNVMNMLGSLALLTNELEEASRYYAAARDLAQTLADPIRENLILVNLGLIEFRLGAIDRAIESTREAAVGLRTANYLPYLAPSLVNLGAYLAIRGDRNEARVTAEEALTLLRDEGGHWLRLCMQLWALLGALDGRYVAAARLIGWVDADYMRSGEVREPLEQKVLELLSKLLLDKYRPDDLAVWASDGAAWSTKRALEFTVDRVIFDGIFTKTVC